MSNTPRRSIIRHELQTKTKYTLAIEDRDTGFVVREELGSGVIKWYPFRQYGNSNPVQRYERLKFVGTEYGKIPSSGFTANIATGYSFSKPSGLESFIRFLEGTLKLDLQGVIFTNDKTEYHDGVFRIGRKDFASLKFRTKNLIDSQRRDKVHLYNELAFSLFPKQVKEPSKLVYMPGDLQKFLSRYSEDAVELSHQDSELIIKKINLEAQTLVMTRRAIEKVYIEDVLSEYKILLEQSTETKLLEERWHQFFKKHSWIFSSILAYPAIYFKDKLNVGGYDVAGGTDQIVDFVFKNELTKNITFIEIKTHLSPILNKAVYRSPDVYSIGKEVTGAIVQVLGQKNNFLKNYHSMKGSSAAIDSINSHCLIIVGTMQQLTDDGKIKSFESFRRSNKDVEIVTFDELQLKMEALLSIFTT